jgi:DNA-binding GntR family transcriptional regulator
MGLGKLSQEDHRAMLQAVIERDIELSVKLLTQHLNRGVDVITRFLASPAGQTRKAAR